MIELECIFYCDESVFSKRATKEKGTKEYLGTDEDPKMVRIGKACNPQEREDILKLLIDYKDFIAQSYEELKTYDPQIITHDIPLKPNAKPF